MKYKPEVHKSEVTGHHGDLISYGGTLYLWVLSKELTSCHLSGT